MNRRRTQMMNQQRVSRFESRGYLASFRRVASTSTTPCVRAGGRHFGHML